MKRFISCIITLTMLFSLSAPALAAESATATSLRLESAEGTVTVKDASGGTKSIRDGMRLYSGYTVETAAASVAYLSLDEAKAIKLDSLTRIEVKKSGKQLEAALSTGQIFFNVTKPLTTDESLNIRTSTMITGLRGTSGFQSTDEVAILEGNSQVTATGPDGNTTTYTVSGGEKLSPQPSDGSGSSDQNQGSYVKTQLTNDDVPAVAAEELAKDTDLQEKVSEQATGLDVPQLVNSASEKRAEQTQEEAQKTEQSDQSIDKQNKTIEQTLSDSGTDDAATDQMFQSAQAPATTGGSSAPSYSSGSSGSSSGGSSGNSSGGSGGGGTQPAAVPVTNADTISSVLSRGSNVSFSGQGTTESLSIPAGRTLTTTAGSSLTLTSSNVNLGTIVNYGTLTIDGELSNLSANTVRNFGELIVNGTFTNGGATAGSFVNSGTVTFGAAGRFLNKANGSISGTAIGGKGLYHTVSFVSNGGSAVDAQEVQNGSAIEHLPTPTSTTAGRRFTGWYTDATLRTLWNSSSPVTGNIILYAGWEAEQPAQTTYIVTFDYNYDGAAAPETRIVTSGGTVEAPQVSREGYSLIGWFVPADDGSLSGDPVSFPLTVSSDLSLKARWEASGGPDSDTDSDSDSDTVTVTFNYDCDLDGDGKLDSKTENVTKGGSVEAPQVSREGYSLIGWFVPADDGSLSGDPVSFPLTVSSDLSLKARWEASSGPDSDTGSDTVTVTFDYNDGGTTASVPVTVDSGKTVAERTPGERSGFTFTGWFPVTDGTVSTTAYDFSSPVTTDLLLRAGWDMTWTLADGTLTIYPAGMKDYAPDTSSASAVSTAPWKDQLGQITSAVLMDGVTSVGAGAFYGCTQLESITFPTNGGVTSIGDYGFHSCTSLTSLTVPDGTTAIGSYAFQGSGLEACYIPTSVETIGSSAFEGRDSSRLYLYYRGTSAQWGQINLESSALPSDFDTAHIIFNARIVTFYDLDGETLIASQPVTAGSKLFERIDGSTDVTGKYQIPIPEWHGNPGTSSGYTKNFEGYWSNDLQRYWRCSFEDDWIVESDGYTYDTVQDDIDLYARGTEWVLSSEGDMTIRRLGNNDCPMRDYQYKTISEAPGYVCNTPWADSYTSIGSVTIGSGITSIGNRAFFCCSGLSKIDIPSSVTSIGNGSFIYNGFESLTIKDTIASIGNCAFFNCGLLSNIYIPSGVKILSKAFGCDNTVDPPSLNIFYGGEEATWNSNTASDIGDGRKDTGSVNNVITVLYNFPTPFALSWSTSQPGTVEFTPVSGRSDISYMPVADNDRIDDLATTGNSIDLSPKFSAWFSGFSSEWPTTWYSIIVQGIGSEETIAARSSLDEKLYIKGILDASSTPPSYNLQLVDNEVKVEVSNYTQSGLKICWSQGETSGTIEPGGSFAFESTKSFKLFLVKSISVSGDTCTVTLADSAKEYRYNDTNNTFTPVN